MAAELKCMDGNEAAARVAYALSEVAAIYPITPASVMGELADQWSAGGRPNLWGTVPEIIEMQSEAGAAGALHGSVHNGALSTTFTASQGLLLMLPNMFKIAGELTPCAIHVAARSIATHALSIFGDHSDVMAARTTGWAILSAGSVQEAHDFALVAHAATLRSRVPFLHFFDGFRTSHQIDKIAVLGDDDLAALITEPEVSAFRQQGLDPAHPRVRGTAQNPDVFFQAREAANPFHDAVPSVVATVFDELATRTGRRYGLVDYVGAPDADRVIVLMGSGAGAAEEATETLAGTGERVGVLKVRLYRPFPVAEFVSALPPTVETIAVLDRTKEPGATGEPLYLDVVAAIDQMATAHGSSARRPRVIRGRYGLSSKEFRPAHVAAIFAESSEPQPTPQFTVGIRDDVTRLSLDVDETFRSTRPDGEVHAVFFGLGSDGTVGANKNSVKIIGDSTELFAQGYFVYDSKKSGSITESHLRFGPDPIRSTYLIEDADFIACHQFGLLDRVGVLDRAKTGATLLLNSPFAADEVWSRLPSGIRRQIIDREIDLWVVDAQAIARATRLGNRINTIMQPCFFQLADIIPPDQAIAGIKDSVVRSYGRRGHELVERNFDAIDRSLAELSRVEVPVEEPLAEPVHPVTNETATGVGAPDFVQRVTATMLAGNGDLLPVSALPPDGSFITATSQYEKRSIAHDIPIWDPDICIDCAKCTIVCPHAAIRMKVFTPDSLSGAPGEFRSKDFRSRDLPDHRMTIQVAPDDCTGCGVCVDVCPAKSKTEVRHKAINMERAAAHRGTEAESWRFFLDIAELDRSLLPHDSVKGSQALQPLFEFSGACAGCGETPYLKLLTQLFGDRMLVANATGCSSIYGGNLPTTPWAVDANGHGPAWSNSLFEDNAEFGLGYRLALDAKEDGAIMRVRALADLIGPEEAAAILDADQSDEPGINAQRRRVGDMTETLGAALAAGPSALEPHSADDVGRLIDVAGSLVRSSLWIVGGDGWAYDIGFGGLDHVLGSGRNVNVLVLDTEAYSNTGGQASKATPRGAVAKFTSSGKATAKKDLGAVARAYGDVYVAQVALGANDIQTVKALLEADAWPGPSLVIAYSTCIAHGIDMSTSMSHQKDATRSGYWPLYRYQPSEDEEATPLRLDSKRPSIPVKDFIASEARFAVLQRTQPEHAEHLAGLLQADIDERWHYYEQLAGLHRSVPHVDDTTEDDTTEGEA